MRTGGLKLKKSTPILVLGMLSALLGPMCLAAQSATPTPEIPGLVRRAERFYRRSAGDVGTILLLVFVAEFDTERNAIAATPEIGRRIAGLTGPSSFLPTSAPRFGEESAAYTGEVVQNAVTMDLAILVVREGWFIYGIAAFAVTGDPFVDVLQTAERRFDAKADQAATRRSSDLLTLLPDLDEIPPGFVLESEGERSAALATPIP